MKTPLTLDLPEEARNLFAAWQTDHDWTRLLVLADWLEEYTFEGDDLAYCFRWMASWHHRPRERLYYTYPNRPSRAVPAKFRWALPDTLLYGDLHRLVFFALPGAALNAGHKFYPSEEAAIADLCAALKAGRAIFGLREKQS